jgi:UDPglucose--hexose-1-phosphate uridylyltransferase
MPLLRYDATTHDWVVFAPERGARPRELEVGAPSASPTETCPFCPGHEDSAGEEVTRVTTDGGGGWSLRIIRNKYPALDRNDGTGHRGPLLFQEAGAYGAHEVVIESPAHEEIMARMPLPQVERILGALLARSRTLAEDPRLGAILVFKNHGEGAGTSIRHPHWQIAATPVVPRTYRQRHAISQDYFDWTSRCLHCDLLQGELADGSRIVAENAAFVAVAPFASSLPYQVRILPRTHAASFLLLPESLLPDLASLLRKVLRGLHGALANPPFNLAVNSAALGDERKAHFHWHVDVLPRLSTPAGFELGSGMHINTVLPEAAAEALRGYRDS